MYVEDNVQLKGELETVKRKLDEMMDLIASREKRDTGLHDKLKETEVRDDLLFRTSIRYGAQAICAYLVVKNWRIWKKKTETFHFAKVLNCSARNFMIWRLAKPKIGQN